MSLPSRTLQFLHDIAVADEIERAFGKLARLVVCSPEINLHAAGADKALSAEPLSLAHLIEQLEAANYPFSLRILHKRTSFPDALVPTHLHRFLRVSLASLAANEAAQVEIVIDDAVDELDNDFDGQATVTRLRQPAFVEERRLIGELEARSRRDAGAALLLATKPSVYACDLYSVLQLEAVALVDPPQGDDPDQDLTRVRRMRQIRRRYPQLWTPLPK